MMGESIGNHKIIAKLGQGGMGTVYQAEDTQLGRKIAIKVLNPALVQQGGKEMERFQSEAKVQASLNHPNIVVLHDFQPYGDSYYMVMEYVEGKTLAEIVRSSGALPPHIAVIIAKQVLDGLSAAHRKGIVHRDLKPSNIMITPEGVCKVMDFGIAKVQGGKSLTATGALVGTVYYMSPEQVRGESVDGRSDLYSFGVILFEMLTGRVPFKDESDFKIMIAHVQTPPPPPTQLLPAIPSALEDIVMRSLGKDADKRYQTAEEVLGSLDAYEEQERALGRGSLYTRRALSQWLEALSAVSPRPAVESATVLDSQSPKPASPAPGSGGQAPAVAAADATPATPNSKPSVPRAWTATPPIPPELRAQIAAQGAPASPGKGLMFIGGLILLIVALAGGTYYFLLGRRNQSSPPQVVASQETSAPPQTAGIATPSQTDPKSDSSSSANSQQSPSPGSLASQEGANPSAIPSDLSSTSSASKTPSTASAEVPAGTQLVPSGKSGSNAGQATSSPAMPMTRSQSSIPPSRSSIPASKPPAEGRVTGSAMRVAGSSSAAPGSSPRAAQIEQRLPQGFLIFFDLDQSSERLPLVAAQSRIAEILRENGHQVVSLGVASSNIRSALDRRDLAEVRRNGVGFIVLGTAHGTLEAQNAYGSTYHVGRVDVNFELVRMSDGAVASTGSGSAKSRGSASASAALSEALMTATSDAARNLIRQFQPQ
jgi:serine/threonine protein kinase